MVMLTQLLLLFCSHTQMMFTWVFSCLH